MFHPALRWRHNDHAGVSNHQPPGCLLNRLFRRKSKKTSKLRVTGLCAGNSPGTGEFSAQMASYAENVSIWWRHHGPMKYNPELRWILSKMHEHYVTCNSRVNMRLWMFKQRFRYIEMIKLNQSLWKVYGISTRMPLVTLFILKIDLYQCMNPHKSNEYRQQNVLVL